MQRSASLFLFLCLALPAFSEEGSAPQTAAQVADAVLATVERGAELKKLAESVAPDPWLVADELCGRGAYDAARAFASAAPRADIAGLPAYVGAMRKHETDAPERKRLAAVMEAYRARQAERLLELSASLPAELVTVTRIRVVLARARALGAARRHEEAYTALRAAADAARALGWLARARVLYDEAAMAATRRFAWERALEPWRILVALQEQQDDKQGMGRTLNNMGLVQCRAGDLAASLESFERALSLAEATRDDRLAASVLGNTGIAYESLGDYARALSTYQRALAQKEALGDRAGAAVTLGNIGAVQDKLGDYAKARSSHERAIAEHEALGDRAGAARSLGELGTVLHALGDYAKALSTYQRAIVAKEALGDSSGAAVTLGNLPGVHLALGNYDEALAVGVRARALMEAAGDRVGAAVTLGNLGLVHVARGDHAKALATFRRARADLQALGRKQEADALLSSIGGAELRLGRYEQARTTLESALKVYESQGQRSAAAWARLSIGRVHRALGNTKAARKALDQSARVGRRLREAPLEVAALRELAGLHLEAGNAPAAFAAAQLALGSLEGLLGGLGEEQGAAARARHAGLFAIGALAAIRDENTADALTFLESGRAGALLDALGKREALRWKAESLSPELRKADREARAAERAARHAYDRAARAGGLKAVRAAGKLLDRALEGVRAVAGRIQRALKQQAGLFYPRAETIEAISASLRVEQALVIYGLCLDEAFALVLRRDAERIVPLGKVATVLDACAAVDVSSPATDPAPALARLRGLLVGPLGLDAGVKCVIVSPEGPLCYVPFAALFDRPLALTPSGTTHVLLLGERRAPGKGILALGDPDYGGISEGAQAIYYRGRTLSPLPASRKEVETIGTTTLVGARASEAGLRTGLAGSASWRAVHLACHGLVDVDRPMLSSLALSREGEDDGFVTALEILRMKIPADLAVLSACETGTGRIVKGEGIVGLTRAFMFAGAPRVLCSLWKVDDEATQALMIKFYELWAPKEPTALSETKGQGLGAAEALRQAQQHVRSHEKWKHPYFWAAWVLWGLPK